MKPLMIALVAFTVVTHVSQSQPFIKDVRVISAGIGLGSSLGGFTSSSQTPALSVQYEQGVWPIDGPGVISLGGYVGYKSFKYSNNYFVTQRYTYNQKWSYTIVGVRSAYHYNGLKTDKFDVFSGFMLSYNIVSYSYEDSNPTGARFIGDSYGSGIGFSWFAGGRYFFTHNLAAMAEFGFGVSYFTIGLAWKL